MAESILRVAVRILTDCLCLVVVCLPTIIVEYNKSILPFHRGFYCDDESIKKPHKDSTISWKYSVATAVLLPTFLMCIIEGIHYIYNPARELLPRFQLGPNLSINYYMWTLYRFLGVYYFGLAICMSFNHIGKITIGRLRPHFISVCQPDWTRVNCSWYVDNDVCTGDADLILEARKSFPSGHSSLAFFTMTYTVIYLQKRMTWNISVILRHALQAVLLWMAYFTALSRISDYKHHWSDVLCGTLLGIVSASLIVVLVSESFRLPGGDDDPEGHLTAAHITVHQPSDGPSRKVSNSSRNSRKVSKSSMSHLPDYHHSHPINDTERITAEPI